MLFRFDTCDRMTFYLARLHVLEQYFSQCRMQSEWQLRTRFCCGCSGSQLPDLLENNAHQGVPEHFNPKGERIVDYY